MYDRLKGAAVQGGSEPDRFGFWAVHSIVKVRRPAIRRGRQLEVLVQFAGADPVRRTPWPMEWVTIKLLKADLKQQARDMERASVAALRPVAAPRSAGSKRWAGLIWDGADEGRPRRSARATVGIDPAEAATSDPLASPPPLVVAAQPMAQVFSLPGGRVPAGMEVAQARYKAGGEVAAAWAMDVCAPEPTADGALSSARVNPTVVDVLPMPASGQPAGLAVAQAWPVGGVCAPFVAFPVARTLPLPTGGAPLGTAVRRTHGPWGAMERRPPARWTLAARWNLGSLGTISTGWTGLSYWRRSPSSHADAVRGICAPDTD
jgi:hypothetical protein